MDAIDSVFYEEVEEDEKLVSAYAFFNSDEGKLVLKDLLKYCYWGAQDPTILEESDAKSVLATQRVLWRIKAMLNCKVSAQNGEDNE